VEVLVLEVQVVIMTLVVQVVEQEVTEVILQVKWQHNLLNLETQALMDLEMQVVILIQERHQELQVVVVALVLSVVRVETTQVKVVMEKLIL
jgi:hypothetical protein